jgi:hypothetical protein
MDFTHGLSQQVLVRNHMGIEVANLLLSFMVTEHYSKGS